MAGNSGLLGRRPVLVRDSCILAKSRAQPRPELHGLAKSGSVILQQYAQVALLCYTDQVFCATIRSIP